MRKQEPDNDDHVEVDDLIVLARTIGKDFDQRALRRARSVLLKVWREAARQEVRKYKKGTAASQ